MTVWRAPGGWRIEVTAAGSGRSYKVTKHGYHIGDYTSLNELEELLETFGVGYTDLVTDDLGRE